MIESEDVLVSLVRQLVGKTKTGGRRGGGPGPPSGRVRDGRLARVEFHLDREAALRFRGRASGLLDTRLEP